MAEFRPFVVLFEPKFVSKDKYYQITRKIIPTCKDCKWLLEHESGEMECEIKQGWFPVKPDWFCADGEKRDE